jgi:carbonic anhydrase
MDTRLTELLPKAMNIHQGDAKVIKVAGAVVAAPFGSVMRSILVAVYELGAKEILVVGHRGCGMTSLRPGAMLEKAVERGIPRERLELLENAGIDLERWLVGFPSETEAVRESVMAIRKHPLIPKDVLVAGLLIDSETGRLEVVEVTE